MARRSTYTVRFSLYGAETDFVDVIASNKAEAYDKAVYEVIPQEFGELPYSAWVESVTYQNGNAKQFNTFEGKPY